MKKDFLEQAESKITTKILDTMESGEVITLNKRFELYKYIDMDSFVLIDTKYDEETFSVQYGDEDEIVLTDFYGYDDNENFYSLK